MTRLPLLLAAVCALGLTSAAQAQTTGPIPDAIKPIRTSGLGLRVSNLEKSMKFYTEALGMKVATKVGGTDGKPVSEYLLGMTGDRQADTLVVLSQGVVPPDAKQFGRIVYVVPNAKVLAERVAANGGSIDRALGTTYIVRDPDGYAIELYQRPAVPSR